MNYGSNTLFESEWAAFALPASLDRPPPRFDFADFETRRLHASLDALDVLGPVLASNAAVMLFTDPTECAPTTSSCMATLQDRTTFHDTDNSTSSSSQAHKCHLKKRSRRQVHELQAMVNVMQAQVNGAAAETQQLAQLVEQFTQQRAQERRRAAEEHQPLFEEHEMDMDLGTQQRRLQAQVKQEREQFVCEQQLQQQHQQQQQQQWHQECSGSQLSPSPIKF
ncbi:unnamed protein product [Peronospora belbahrii]|uniref:Uncharacterized protein n=1 Tax=Peronospora belbahrii TaxID=622444 RepID=A0AAU9L6N9_9STRA|nr:unnamed protein product [Peronospora belbahrii]CAH0519256.1 unnamed protein product [Peronospora belbahrii]